MTVTSANKNKIHLIIPMCGGGTRFINKGFDRPKPLIELQGKPFFYWACQSILKFVEVHDITFVVLKEHVDIFNIDAEVRYFYPAAKIQIVRQVLNGAVLTCREGIKSIEDDLPILFNDCDHAFVCPEFYKFCRKASFNDIDAALLTFESDSPNFSYVKFDENGHFSGTIEKMVASKEAICGAYYFKNKDVFYSASETYLTKCSYKELFMSGVYNELINGEKISTFKVDEHISFGTPDEYYAAVNDERVGKLI